MKTASAAQQLSPETWALLACAQTVIDERRLPAFREAVAACGSAERLCNAAVQRGMVGHLHHQIAAQSDTSFAAHVAEPLQKLYRVSMQRNLHQAAELLRLLEKLRGLGVEAMPIKGPVLAEALYGDVTLRNWVDLDLLVRHEQVPVVRDLLLWAGFRDSSPFNLQLLGRKRRTTGELHFESDEGDLLDVHWQVSVGYEADALPAEVLLPRAQARTLLGRTVPGPSDADTLLMTCLHGTHHRWNTVEGLLAVAVQVRDTPAGQWSRLLAAARDAGCARRVTVGVAHVCRVFGLPLPPELARVLGEDRYSRALLRSLGPTTIERGVGQGGRVELTDLAWTIVTEDSIPRALEHAAVRAFRPHVGEWESVALPAGAEWLYYPLRPLRLVLKWLRRVPTSRSLRGG